MLFPSYLITGGQCRYTPFRIFLVFPIFSFYCQRHPYPYVEGGLQCARRWYDEGQTSHLVNLGKYVSAMLAAGAKLAYEKERTMGWLCLVVAMSSAATVYQLYWDFVKDWGLLQFNSRNPWLRNELMLRRKIIYYFSMVYIMIRFFFVYARLFSSSKGAM